MKCPNVYRYVITSYSIHYTKLYDAHFHAKGIDIGLGTDISGGFSPSLFDNVRQAVISSRMLEDGVDPSLPAHMRGVPESRITVDEAFYLATAGGGESLSLPIGRLEQNYAWDVQIIDTKLPSAKLPIFDENEDLHGIFEKIMYLARPENIREVWVQGMKVHSRVITSYSIHYTKLYEG